MTATDTSTIRQPTLAGRYSPADADLERYVSAIARRNTAWHHWRTAEELLDAAEHRGARNLVPWVRNYNQAQQDYEHAARDLHRARVRWQTEGGTW